MFYLYPTKKLLKFSSLDSQCPIANKREHFNQDWYTGIAGTGFNGEFLVLYVHRPSLLTVIAKGKTIQETYDVFLERLGKLLARFSFPSAFVANALLDGGHYMILEPCDSHMVSQVNQFMKFIAYSCSKGETYEGLNIDAMEDRLMCHIYQYNSGRSYLPPLAYWEQKLGFKAKTKRAF